MENNSEKENLVKKKKRFKILKKLKTIVTMLAVIGTLTAGIIMLDQKPTFADSGFSTSHSSSSSSHSSSHSSSSYSGSSSGEISPISILIFMIVFIIVALYDSKKKRSNPDISPIINTPNANTPNANILEKEQKVIDEIKKVIPDFDANKYINDTFNIYKDVQEAWMNFKLEDVQGKITDELYNMYESQLATLEVKGQQNIMKDMIMKVANLTNVENQNNTLTITGIYVVEQYDYIADAQTGKLINGKDKTKMQVNYEMKFRMSIDKNAKLDKCPNCGADISHINAGGKCEYCGSKIVLDNTKLVLTQKNVLSQRDI